MDAVSSFASPMAPRRSDDEVRPFVDLDQLTPDSRLTRRQLAEALTRTGHPTTAGALAGYAHRGDGPPYVKWGWSVLYVWGPALRWAKARYVEVPA